MDTLLQDLRYALRGLRRRPAFTVVAVLTLALGIGANTAIFSAVYTVLLRPLPYPESDRIVRIYEIQQGNRSTVSPSNFADWQSGTHAFQQMGAYYGTSYALTDGQTAEQVTAATVTPGVFAVFGVAPALGRGFIMEDAAPGHDHVVILSYGLWQRRFGGSSGVLGTTVRLDGEAYTIVGVMPRGFPYPSSRDVWTPLWFSEQALATQRGAHYLSVVGRLKDGVTLDQAGRDVATLAERLAAEYPNTNAQSSALAITLRESLVGRVQGALNLLLGAVGLVLLIACANVANLLLARGIGRGPELAVRSALGASRSRLVRALLTESVVIGMLGGAAGLLLALWGVEALIRLAPEGIPGLDQTAINGTVLAFTAGVSVLTGLVFGLLPALQASRPLDLGVRLKTGGRGAAGPSAGRRTRGVLVVAEMALAVMLVVGAGLLLRSFLRLERVDPGFQPDGVLAFDLSLPAATYAQPPQADAFYTALLERLRSLPGVTAAGASSVLPLTGSNYSISLNLIDGTPPTDQFLSAEIRLVTPEYFRTLGIPVRRGRAFTDADRQGAPAVVVVNDAAARLLWPGTDPLGHTLQLGTRFGLGGERAGGTVVGVAGDVHQESLRSPAEPIIYVPHRQFPIGSLSVVLRTSGAPGNQISAATAAVAALDRDVPVYGIHTMSDIVAQSIAQPHFYALLLGLFAATALALAAVGIYGVMAYAVESRTHEMGVRMALGARPGDVRELVVRSGLGLAGGGLVLGLVASLLLTRVLTVVGRLLYGVEPTDFATYAGVTLLLLAVALVASYLPARRATKVDPMVALRYE